ncbi:MAG: MFS transporter [Burkholderiales bacterium]|nr:MFS transporter [Burkholderiales bacterium]
MTSVFFERFAFYGIRWALVLYFVLQLNGGDSTAQTEANLIYSSYLALLYAAAIIGGLIADRLLGHRTALAMGAVLMACGIFTLLIPDPITFKYGLAAIVVGNGLYKPTIAAQVSKLFDSDSGRDSGFTIFHMAVNAAGLIGPFATQYMATKLFGTRNGAVFEVVFFAAGISMALSLLCFSIGKGAVSDTPLSKKQWAYSLALLTALILVANFLLHLDGTEMMILLVLVFLAALPLLVIESLQDGKFGRNKMFVLFSIFVLNTVFWAIFEYAGSSVNLLAINFANFDGADSLLTSTMLSGVTLFALIVSAPLLALLWLSLARYQIDFLTLRKFCIGVILIAVSFAILMSCVSTLLSGEYKISPWPFMLVFLLHALGELCIAPIGLSLVSKFAPVKLVGLAIGCWYFSTSLGTRLAGVLAGFISGNSEPNLASFLFEYQFAFYSFLFLGILLFIGTPYIYHCSMKRG